MDMSLSLSSRVVKMERKQYTIFMLLSDLGGFNGAIIIFPSYIMSFYSERQYKSSVASQTPIRKIRGKKKNKKDLPELQKSLLKDQNW